MHGIGSVYSPSFITRMLATVSLLALYALGTVALTGALTLASTGSAAADPNYYRYRGARGYSRGRGTIGGAPRSGLGLSIGPGGMIGIGSSGGFNAVPTGSRSGEVRSNSAPKAGPGGNRSTALTQGKPKSRTPTVSAPLQGQNKAGREKTPAPMATPAPDVPTAFPPRQSPASAPGSPPFNPGGTSRGAGEMQNPGSRGVFVPGSTGGAGQGPAASRSVPVDRTGATRDSGASSRGRAGGSSSQQESLGADRDGMSTSRDKASKQSTGASRDGATAPRDAADGSRDSTVAARDGAAGGTLKAEDIRRAIDRCAQTYVSYDRVTMTYTDHQGDKQSCP